MKVLALLLVFLLPSTVFANEILPAGTVVQLPSGEQETLQATHFLLTRPEIEAIVVKASELERCKQNVVTCQDTLRENTNPKPGFWRTSTGKQIMVGGFAFSVTGAFLGGFYLAQKTQ